jgi:hypothetical protein
MGAQLGHKLNENRARRLISTLAPSLAPGEEVLALMKCNNLRPTTVAIAVTDLRLAGLATTGWSVEFPFTEPFTIKPDADKQTVLVTVLDPTNLPQGSKTRRPEMLFKMVQKEDHALLTTTLSHALSAFDPGSASRLEHRVDRPQRAEHAGTVGVREATSNKAEPRIFISYRRNDCQSQANGLHDGLRHRLDRSKIFMDIDSIPIGADFEEHIRQEIEQCDVVLVLIGDEWLDPRPGAAMRRIDEPNDFVRLEIESSLQSEHVRVIPVLVEGAQMPQRDELPESIQRLARLHAFELSDSRWTSDIERLSVQLREFGAALARSPSTQPSQPSATWESGPARPPGQALQREADDRDSPVQGGPTVASGVPVAEVRSSLGADGVLWGKRAQQASRTAMPAISGWMMPGERIVGLFKVTKIRPDLALIVVTDRRVLACQAKPGVYYQPPVAVQWADLDRVEVSDFADSVVLHRGDGALIKLGFLAHSPDKDALLYLASRLLPGPPG